MNEKKGWKLPVIFVTDVVVWIDVISRKRDLFYKSYLSENIFKIRRKKTLETSWCTEVVSIIERADDDKIVDWIGKLDELFTGNTNISLTKQQSEE